MINAAARVLNQAAMAERSSDAMVTGQWSKRSLRQGNRGARDKFVDLGQGDGWVRAVARLGRRDDR